MSLDEQVIEKITIDPFEDQEDDLCWLELDNIPEFIAHPLMEYAVGLQQPDPVEEMTRLFMNKDYLHFVARMLLNIELPPYQAAVLDVLWTKRLPMLIGSRGAAKSFMLGAYCLLRMVLNPGCKIVIVGAGLRQSRQVFDYMVQIWDKAPILIDIAGKSKTAGPRREVDRFQFEIGDSRCWAIPIGSGDKIRGLRANHIIADEFSSIPEEIFNLVVQGFAVVSSSPIEKIKEAATIKKLKKMGEWTEDMENWKFNRGGGNQIIYSGTAFFSFNHFYKRFVQWHQIIASKGDPRKLKEILGSNDSALKGFRWQDYGIVRIPYNQVPEGLLDEGILAQGKATLTRSQFLMEFGACLSPCQEIITDKGIKKIIDIDLGDMVLTHKGRFRPVIKKTNRYANGLVKLLNYGNNQPILVTPDHPFWVGDNNWINAECITQTYGSALKEFSGLKEVDLIDYTYDAIETTVNNTEYLYPRPSQLKNPKDNHKLYKSCVVRSIKVDYNFGLIMGYYASEGSSGNKSQFIEFSLDGHKDIKLENFINELVLAIRSVFYRDPKIYREDINNCCKVVICSRLIKNLIKSICPGLSDTKFIDPKILYSNESFAKGFLTGYWHGDGCIHHKTNGKIIAIAACVNKGLLAQVKNLMSYFGIPSALNNRAKSKIKSFIRGREVILDNCKPIFSLASQGDSAIKLNNLINNKDDCSFNVKGGLINFDGEKCIYSNRTKKFIDYKGLVYNLEVEEDNSYSLINATVHNCFAKDTDGFYKRSILESATTNKPILLPSGELIQFNAMRVGDPKKMHVIGIDPAADRDNAAIVVLELNQDHRKIVYCWTTNKKKYNELRKYYEKQGEELSEDYYRYIAKKIRSIMRSFNTEHITMDKNGGGTAIAEALKSPETYQAGESPIYPLIDSDDPKPDDMRDGLHLLELMVPTQDINADANHGMLKDFQDKILLFPMFNTIEVAKAVALDSINGIEFDTYEDLVQEVEELKTEITTVVVTPSSMLGKESFDTPQIKGEGQRKGHLRKDRYSALLYANFYARQRDEDKVIKLEYKALGKATGDVSFISKKDSTANKGMMYHGPGLLKYGSKTGWNKTGISQVRFIKHK